MSLLIWVLFGVITGVVTSFFVDPEEQGLITTVMLGILGSVVGGLLISLLFELKINEVTFLGVVFAVFSAWLVIRIGQFLKPTDMY